MYSIIVHGGAGEHDDPKKAKKGVLKALSKGKETIKKTNNPIKAVEESINILEDLRSFNAGKGSVLTLDGEIKMDACIASSDNKIGAITNVEDIRHPIRFAKKILKNTDHVLVGGKNTEKLIEKLNIEKSNPYTLKRIKERKKRLKDINTDLSDLKTALIEYNDNFSISDTVGAVAINDNQKLCAGTSTGGKPLKLNGRIGDSPIYGAGTYADKNIAASATGDGEGIIKSLLTKKLAIKHNKTKDLSNSIERTIKEHENIVKEKNKLCGIIAIDKKYNISFNKNTDHLPIAYAKNDEIKTTI